VAVLLGLLVMIPSLYSVDAQEDRLVKIESRLLSRMRAAAPNEYVTAVVRFHGRPSKKLFGGSRPRYVSELRDVARRSHDQAESFLSQPSLKKGVKRTKRFWLDNIMLVEATPDVIEALAEMPDVVEVFENIKLHLPPRQESDAGILPTQSQAQLWDSMEKIGAKQVWTTYGFDGAGVVVGVLDTGCEGDHPDLAGRMVTNDPSDPTFPGGWAEFDSNGDMVVGSVPHDSDEHGTHTTGTCIGGNASGYDIGVAPGAQFMHALVIPGGSGTFTQVIAGMEWIIDPDGDPMTDDGADVINMSLGGAGAHDVMVVPVDNVVAADVFPAMSIGNSGPSSGTTGSPGNVPSAYGVGATDSTDVIASFSSRGPVTWNTPPYVGTYIKPDIAAPGVQIYSSVPGGEWQWHGGGQDWSGTSMASPHVAGAAALMRQANPSMDVEVMKQLLAQTAIDLGDPGKDNDYGWGRLDAFQAVSAALAGVGTLEGIVYSSVGGVVHNAQVLIMDTGQRVYTDATGAYTMQLVAGDHQVEVSRFGYETYSTTVTVVADATTPQDFTLNQLPSGNVAGLVTDGGTGEGIACDITVRLAGESVVWGSTDPVTGAYDITLPVGIYDIVFSPIFPYPVTMRTGVEVLEAATTTVNVALDGAQILIVDDDTGDGFEAWFEAAVLAAGRSYLTVTTPPTAAEMALFESVVWLTGNDYQTTLSTADQAELAAYLDGGGRLFLSGQDIGYDIRTEAFYADYMHATYVQDDVGLRGCLGVDTSPIGATLAFDIQGGTGASNQGYPSEIDVLYPALPAFVYDETVLPAALVNNDLEKGEVEAGAITSSGTAGLTVDNGVYKLVYFSFGFEAIAGESDRAEVMTRVLDWLLGYPKIVHEPLVDTENTEDPYRVAAFITSDYFTLDPASFAVVYDVGAGDVILPLAATGIADEYEAFIPAQPVDTEISYYIIASDVEGHTSTSPVAAPGIRHVFYVGWDEEPPVVFHDRHYNTNDLDGPYHIYADVTDNIGVESVWLMYSKNGGLFCRQLMEMVEEGSYHGAIPGPSEVGDMYDYYILAMDESYRGNVTRVPASGTYSFEIVEYFLWDFEPDDGGFAALGDVWEWGAPTSGPGGAYSGDNAWATILGGSYPSSADATLDVPVITLAASKPYAMLAFWHWYEFEGNYTHYDAGNVKISTDGGATWEVITPVGGYDGVAGSGNAAIPGEECFAGTYNTFWQQELFDLSPYTGNDVTIRFHFGSDYAYGYAGWYVDDVMIRSTDVDDVPPTISNTVTPESSFDTAGPYHVSTTVTDFLGDVALVSLYYSVDEGAWVEVPMTGSGDDYEGDIPGQPNGSRIRLYVRAEDTSGNETLDPVAGTYHEFSILPSAEVLVVQGTSYSTSLDMFKEAFAGAGIEADFWYRYSQGWLEPEELALYKVIVLDESSGLTAEQRGDLTTWLEAGSQEAKRRFWIMGRDLGYNYSTRPWLEEFMKAAYVQDNPGYRELTGYPGEPIGAEETFVISGSYPDEIQRSTTYPGGELVYQYTGEGTTALTREELAGEYEKGEKEWDGVMPHAPISLDAGAGIKCNAETYRSVYFSFNLYYVQEPERRSGIVERALGWLSAPDIVHEALHDSEDTLNAYTVLAEVYSETLDPARINLVYDVGLGPVTELMTPTGTPGEYSADIPPQGYGTTVSYYISAANTDGNTSYHPHGAPAAQHIFEVTADRTPPEIVHAPLTNTADQAGPWTVGATITDNVGVDPASVQLTFNKNGGANTVVAMTNVAGDYYEAQIAGPGVLGDLFNYYITARDVAALPNTSREPTTGYHTFEIVDYYAWDFEASDGGFAADGPDWQWGEPTYGPSGAYSGVNVWATQLGGNYSSSSNSTLDLPTLTVPTSQPNAVLTWWQWYYMEDGYYSDYDGGNVKISTDGGATWSILQPDIGYNGVASSGNAGIPGEECFTGDDHLAWEKVTVDMTPYIGQPVIIRFHFGSDSSVNYAGWYIDDVRIEGVADTEGPVFVTTEVPASTFDTVGPYTVTSTIVDALSGVAAATLYYSVDEGMTWNDVPMAAAGGDDWASDIPGQTSGTRIRFYLSAEDGNSNSSVDPAGAPGAWYEFGIMPSGDYLVLLGGGGHTPATMFQAAFSAIGETVDIWDWDDLGLPTVDILLAYTGIVVDESWYLDAAQMTLLSSYLDTDDSTRKQIFILGRDLSYGSSARPWMEQYTGAAYVKDDPGWRELTSTAGDPIGNDETFVISGSFPDEVELSSAWPGGSVVYYYSAQGSTLDIFDTEAATKEFYEKAGKPWDPKVWPNLPDSEDAAAGVKFIGPVHNSVYFSFNFNYIQEETRRAEILGRVLDWLGTAGGGLVMNAGMDPVVEEAPEIPDQLTLWQNYPNPFNPVTRIQFGIPSGYDGPVELRIYNVKGQLVKTIFEGVSKPGIHEFEWNGINDRGVQVTSGIYFCRFIAAETVMTRKMVLLR
jgi:subtilisin family serine protease